MSKDKNVIPDFVLKNLKSSIWGRIKLNIYKIISKKDDYFPSDREIKKFLRKELRSNFPLGELYAHILANHSPKSALFNDLQKPKKIQKLLKHLENSPLKGIFFLEIRNCPIQFVDSIGVCIYCERLSPEGYVYVVTFFDTNFPKHLLGRLEIRASQNYPSPMFSEMKSGKFNHYDQKNYAKSFLVVLTLKILEYMSKNPDRKFIPMEEAVRLSLEDDNIHNPPEDKTQIFLTKAVWLGYLKCTQTHTSLSSIKPYSWDFCINYPSETIKKIAQEIKSGETPFLLVYWNKSHFVMSDDYGCFLAYKSLAIEEVPITILGEFPHNSVKKLGKVGGKELIPPVRIESSPDYSQLSDEFKDWVLEHKLRSKKQSEVVLNLFGLFIGLCRLISDTNVKERQIHNFIIKNPSSFDVYGSCIMSEVWLGKKYRVDLAIQYKLDEKKIQLIELERANIEIFTEKGRFRSYVTHAIQQVEHWLQWWNENPSERPKSFDSAVLPQGLVVIGRNENLTEEDKKRLTHLNSTRQVKVITYDDLLDRIESVIENLEDIEEKNAI